MESQPGREPRDWEALRRWDPERIGPYVVLGRLGYGSMGQVYMVRSAAGRLVAVKTIRVELAEETGFRTRFAQEVAAARKVSGVFTAAVVEADPEADLPWLATEDPDLSGLPAKLSEVVTACLHRVPRARPTSSAMLVQLGDFTVAQAVPDEEHSYLPDKAMALIAEYQRSPQIGPLGEFAGERADDATSASYTELPASFRPARRRKPVHGPTGPGRTDPGTGAGA